MLFNMSDEVDVANGYAEVARTMQESCIRAKANELEVKSTGNCLDCGEPLKAIKQPKNALVKAPPPRWCDSDCRDRWAAKKRH
jgi:hypothetical protein